MTAFFAASAFAFAALFDVQTVALPTPEARVFLAQADGDTSADVFVLEGRTLTAYPSATPGGTLALRLPDDASVFDVADTDGDLRSEVVAVCGDRIVRYLLALEPSEPQVLFAVHSQLSAPVPEPSPFVLVLPYDGKPAIALPCERAFELHSPDGTLLASYPIGEGAPQRVSYGSPFMVASTFPPHVGTRGAIELSVSRTIAFIPELPEEVIPISDEHMARRQGTWTQTRDAGSQKENSWPWFPLELTGPSRYRALYAFTPPSYRNTSIRIRRFASAEAAAPEKNVATGPERHYPGNLIVLDDEIPDFNHDGWADLLLWRAPEPGLSIDALTRAATGGVWNLRLTAHLFDPKEHLFASEPSSRIACAIPLPWFLTPDLAGPMKHTVLRDFDGDGRTDLAGCVTASRYCVWLYGEQGFSAEPAFDHTFAEPIDGVDFRADLDGKGCTSLGLRSATHLYVLHAGGNAR